MSLSLVRQDAQQALPAPASFGAYEVEALLGEGTMGSVYRARHQTLGRKVAVKSLHPALLGDPALVRRFLQEARLVNTINHPHIVEVHDFVEATGQVYAVMELLEGETLTSRLAGKALALDTIVRIATEVAEALEAAHALSVVHRDLKPDNIFLTQRDGRDWVKVLDFGVAKLINQDGPRVIETQNGDVLGTPRYMAPEQAAGLDVDARTDIYALGTVLFEMLAGRPPFEATVFGQLAADIITRPPPPVPTESRTGETVPEPLRKLVAACLSKNADHRPPTMSDVVRQLKNLDVDLEFGPLVRRPRWYLPVALLTVSAIAAGIFFALNATPVRPPPVLTTPPQPPPVVAVEAKELSLGFETSPAGAAVIDEVSGDALGVTPLTLKRREGGPPLKLRFELKGFEPLSREFSSDQSLRVELPLKKLVVAGPKKTPKAVTDGVIDPF